MCLAALEGQSLPAARFEIIVAVNEAEPAWPLGAAPANLRWVHQPRPGSYAARNAAAAVASGEFLAFTDSDCVPSREWLRAGLDALRANPGVRVTGPVALFRAPGTSESAWRFEKRTAYRQLDFVAAGRCTTANLMVERVLFDRIGPFDEDYSGGDFRWSDRASARGIPIRHIEAVAVAHHSRRTMTDILAQRRRFAGAACRRVSFPRFVARRLLSPLRRIAKLRGSGIGRRELLYVAAVQLLCDLVQIPEYALVRIGAKPPRRN